VEGFGEGSERVSIASAESRGNVGTATIDHARIARSLPTGAYSASLLSFFNSDRRLFNHAGLKFLRYSILQPDLNFGSIESAAKREPFDLFLSPMPQSGSTKIVFASNREGSMQIYVMNGDGSALTRLTYSGANDDYPRWSPNGAKILFQSDRDNPWSGYMDIYVMNSDGSGATRLTTDANDDSMASWSPDGTKIVFQSFRNGVNYQVYSMNADGSSQVCLTNTSSNDVEPSWSPNGAKIAFASDRDHSGTNSVYVMNSNGTGQQRLTFSAATFDDRQPSWSRDGAKIAFVSTRDSVTETWTETDDYEIPEDDGQTFPRSRLHINKEIYVMNADGSSQLRLTNDLANDDAPSWSPDGSKIVFRSDRERDCCDPSAQIWTMNMDGSSQSDVSNDGAGNYTASWTNGSGNMSPVANAGGAYNGTIAQNVPFHGNNSYDPDGTIVSYSWNFGDGGSSSGINPTHAYSANGSYTVTLTVTDNLGVQATAQTTANISTSSSDQFAQNFLYWGLGRAPNGDENGYWSDIMRAAYPQGQTSMLMAMKEFGMTVFESAEYAGRAGRQLSDPNGNHNYVYDLYKTYLMRDPDQDGWNFWTGVCNTYGRDAVRQAFDESGEFHDIVASLSASGNPSSAVTSLATAQVDPFNQSGNQVQARDCEWSVPIISLPGRAGLDLGLRLSYSSLVWTRSGPYAYFDRDFESLSPGFTIGFPTIQWRKFDAQTRRNAYILTRGGRHVELRQVGSSNIYEAADSSYLQLIDYGGSLSLRTTDGTELSFTPLLYGWNVTQIRDRNGNFITVENDWRGDIQHVTDTLGRTINFIYDNNANLIRVEQTWTGQSQPHVWASFGWGSAQIQPTFGEVVGTYAGENVLALNFVGFDDGSYTRFNYNGYAQVREIKHFASDSNPATDNHLLNTTVYNYGANDDPTRLTDIRVSAENWTGVNNVPSQVITQFSVGSDGAQQMSAPDGTTYKEFYGGTGSSPVWQHGLVIATQVITGSTVQKTTSNLWTQDDADANYQTNPRVYQTDVSDGTNHRKTTIGYQTFTLPTTNASCSLPNEVYEYAADQTNVLRRTHTDYNLTANYINDYRRIIGLPLTKLLYEGTSTLRSKTTYIYDQGGEFMQNTAAPVIQHDDYSYSTGFVVGRGNLTKVTRWDVDDPNQTARTENKIAYNITGNIIFARDAMDHQTSMGYADAFSIDGTSLDSPRSFATFAYPTTMTDADGFSATLWYRYDFGAKTRAQGPPPQNQANGTIQTFLYDDAARLQRATTQNNGAYTRYVYWPNFVQSFSTINNVADEGYTNTLFDGLGRTIGVATNHPGSIGGYKAQLTQYDVMGRPKMVSNPTEIDGSWSPSGEDSSGYVYTQQTYDWKNRPLETRHLIGGTVKHASYDGCGCAGGEVVTLTDEAGKQQKVYSDTLGREWKTEVLTDGNVFSTTVSVYNARDQVTNTKQYSGLAPGDASSINSSAYCPSGTCQEGSTAYDGYGRPKSKHAVEYDAGTATTYTYNVDDTVNSVSDPRGASATYIYNNNRGLVNGINYYSPSGVANTPNVSFTYDAAGNRTSMNDGLGSTSYNYDSLSRLTSETRTFDVGSFTLSYDYNYAGELTRVTDPTNASIYYGHDAIGRVSSVTGSPYGTGGYGGIPYVEVSQYASNMQYRAFGGLKSLNYGNGLTLGIGYDSRLRPIDFEVAGRPPQFGPSTAMKTQYQYYPDDTPKYSHDLLDERFDRAFWFDDRSAMKEAYSGSEARDFVNNTSGGGTSGPFRQSYQHDAFGNMTSRTSRFWSHSETFTATYTNNRKQDPAFHYDPAGHLTQDSDLQYTYDATGLVSSIYGAQENKTTTMFYAGDGKSSRRSETQAGATIVTYFVWSSVLNQVITELNQAGAKVKTNVYLGQQVLARQEQGWIVWQHDNPISGTRGISSRDGGYSVEIEPDPMGVNVGQSDPFIQPFDPPPTPPEPGLLSLWGGESSCGSNPNCTTCYLDGFQIGCAEAFHMLDIGAAEFHTQTTVNVTYTSGRTESFTGYTNLPPGLDIRFTGSRAVIAYAWFDYHMPDFATGVYSAIFHASQSWGDGRPNFLSGASFSFAQQSTAKEVRVPIGGLDKMKAQLEQALKYSDCREALQKLLAQVGVEAKFAPSHTDMMDLFNALRNQTGGGGIYVDLTPSQLQELLAGHELGEREPGGGGEANFFYTDRSNWRTRQRWSAVYLSGAYSDSRPLAFERLPYLYLLTLIHELTHNAPNDDSGFGLTYTHAQMDAAAVKLGTAKGGFDQYVREHCIPKKYW
jgi:YD repeat-containing protein